MLFVTKPEEINLFQIFNNSNKDTKPSSSLTFCWPFSKSEYQIEPFLKSSDNKEQAFVAKFQESSISSIINYLKTFQGSLEYQRKLEVLGPSSINLIFMRLSPYLRELMCSKHANYFTQKLFRKIGLYQRLYVFKILKDEFIQICTDSSGSHAIQGLIDAIQTPIEEKFLETYLKNSLLELFCNENSHHVIQKIILDFPDRKRAYINQFVLENIDRICENEFGYYCVSKFIMMTKDVIGRKLLSQVIKSNAVFTSLISNRFGSSVTLYAITTFGIGYFEEIFRELRESNNLIFYATLNKSAANFIGKFFEYINQLNHSYYIQFLVTLINPKGGFVKTLLGINFGEKLLYTLLKMTDHQVIEYFKMNYNNIPKGKLLCQKLNLL